VKRRGAKSGTRAAQGADTVAASMLPMEIQIGDRFNDHDFERW